MNIPFLDLRKLNEPYLDAVRSAACRVIDSGRYIGGPEVHRFEQALASYNNVDFVVGVSNGLDALRLILEGYRQLGRLNPGDEVIVPANTYIASILAISASGLKPVLVEPSIETLNIDSSLVERHITSHTRAIMTVHLYGRAAWDDTLADIARRHSLLVIEDNAQGIGTIATSPGISGKSMTGSLGHAAAFSFYPTKNLGAMGDAGAVATDDAALAAAVRALANYGSDRRYHNIYKGFNCRMDPVQAAVLTVKLPSLDADNARRRAIAAIYDAEIINPGVIKQHISPSSSTNYHQYVIRIPEKRDLFRQQLAEKGVATDIHYAVPPHQQPCYASTFAGSYPVTEKIARQVTSLPIAPYLSDEEARYIASAINTCL